METNDPPIPITIRFLGAAGTVTGSKTVVEAFGKKIMVDCGMFQGLKELRLLNWQELPLKASEIDFVLLTHGHLDHTGYLPGLVKSGFKGKIYGTSPTLAIARIILEDSARIQEEDADRANKEKFTKHNPALPLYTLEDVKHTLPLFEAVSLKEPLRLSEHIVARFRYNGHILGAAFIELKVGEKMLVFSGDIGRENDPLMFPAEKPSMADILFMESTYGDRLHPGNTEQELCELLNTAISKGGTIIIPSFAVERTQALMLMVWNLQKKNKISHIPVYMDSPMGRNVFELFIEFPEWHTLSIADCRKLLTQIRIVETMKDTLRVAADKTPKIVIAGSGMASGGRVLTYFQFYLDDPNATILLAGYQAEGTRGRKLLDGEKSLKIFGKYKNVKARIGNIEGLSAHADQGELIRWLDKLQQAPGEIFIVHGEKTGAEALKQKIAAVYGWNSTIPQRDDIVTLNSEMLKST
jgi:metallo-beta-lactamase family protein